MERRRNPSALSTFASTLFIHVAPKQSLPGGKMGLAFLQRSFWNVALLRITNLLGTDLYNRVHVSKAKSTITNEMFIIKDCRAVFVCSNATKMSLCL